MALGFLESIVEEMTEERNGTAVDNLAQGNGMRANIVQCSEGQMLKLIAIELQQ